MTSIHLGKISLSVILSALLLGSSPLLAKNEIKGKLANISGEIGKGKWIIVEAWHSKCKVCMSSMPEMVRSIGSYRNAKVVGVSLDGNRKIAKGVIRKYNINFPTIYSNVNEFNRYVKKVAHKKLTGVPTFLIFSPKGDLVAYQSGKISPKQIKSFIHKQPK